MEMVGMVKGEWPQRW